MSAPLLAFVVVTVACGLWLLVAWIWTEAQDAQRRRESERAFREKEQFIIQSKRQLAAIIADYERFKSDLDELKKRRGLL